MQRVADFHIKIREGYSIDVYRTSDQLLTISLHTPPVAMEAILTHAQARELVDALQQELDGGVPAQIPPE